MQTTLPQLPEVGKTYTSHRFAPDGGATQAKIFGDFQKA